MKKVFSLLGLTAIAGAAVLGASQLKKAEFVKTDAANNFGAVKYMPIDSDHFYKDNNSFSKAGTGIDELTSGRNDTFHDGKRSFNSLENFINTMSKTGEGEKGWIRSHEWVHTGGYVSFLLGGNSSCFVNLWVEPDGGQGGADVTQFRNDFYASRNAFDTAYINGEASDFELSANMALKFYHIPDEYINRRFIVYICDDADSYYGGITFGDLKVNQTLEEVTKTFSAHKAQIALDAKLSAQNQFSANYMLNTYYKNNEKYGELINAEANITNVNDDFEENVRLTNWAYDQQNSTYENGDLASIDFGYMYSDKDYKWGGYFYDNDGLMPVNKTGNKFLTGEPNDIDSFNTGLPESAKYRLVSPEFKLTGTGLISAKIGGHYARLSLLDSNYNVLLSTGNNPSFVDANMSNIVDSGARMCTMTRTYLDCSAYLNQRVHVAIEDSQTGGGWGLAFFDEIVTNYETLPSFKLDVIHQHSSMNENVYNGVIADKLVVGETYNEAFKEAYDFVSEYYGAARSGANNFSWCEQTLTGLQDDYDALSPGAKAIVDASEDFHYGDAQGHFEGDYFFAEVNKQYTIGESMTALKTGVFPTSGSQLLRISFNEESTVAVVIVVALVSVSTLGLLIMFKKKRAHI